MIKWFSGLKFLFRDTKQKIVKILFLNNFFVCVCARTNPNIRDLKIEMNFY